MDVYACIWGGGGEGCRRSMRFEIGPLWEKKWADFFLDNVPNCRGPVFPGVLPYLVPDVSGSITMRHFWLEFSYYFRNSLDLPCVCFWCYMYKGKENHNGLHVTKSMWVLKCSVQQNDQSGIKLQNRTERSAVSFGLLVRLKLQDSIYFHLYLSILILSAL